MHNSKKRLHTAISTIRGYSFARARNLERELLAVHRELSALQNSYLELGLQASTFAQEREAALDLLRKTETYIQSLQSDADALAVQEHATDYDHEAVKAVGAETEAAHKDVERQAISHIKTAPWWKLFNTIRGYFTPYTRSLESELSSLRRELTALGNKYLELGDRANTLGSLRDAAVDDLEKARDYAEHRLVPGHKAVQPEEEFIEPAGESRSDLIAQKLKQTQIEKNDIAIKLAESDDRIAVLKAQRAQFREEMNTLTRQLTDVGNQHAADVEENQSLLNQLERARQEHTSSQQRIQELEKRSIELERQMAAARQQIENLELSLAAASERQQESDNHLKALEQELDAAHREHDENLRATAQKLHQTHVEKNDIEIRLAEDASRIEALKALQAQLRDEIHALTTQLANAENQHTADAEENQSLINQLERARQEHASSQQLIDELEKRSIELERQMAAARQQIEDLELSLAAASARRQESDNHARALEQELDAAHREHDENLRATAQKLHQTQVEKNDIEIRLAEDASRIEALKALQAQLRDEIHALTTQLANAENQHTADAEENQSLINQLELARKEHANSRQLIDELEKRSIELEWQMATARQHIEQLELSLAEASFRQEVEDKQIVKLQRKLEEEAEAHEQHLNQMGEKLAAAQAEKESLLKQQPPPQAPAVKRHEQPLSWAKIAAGFVFLIGVLASANRLWDIDYSSLRIASVSKDVKPVATPVKEPDVTPGEQATPTSDRVVAFASIEPEALQPDDTVGEESKPVSPLSRQAKENLLSKPRDVRAKRRSGKGGLHSYGWFMEDGDSMVARKKACEERGVAAEECAALEQKLFEEGVIRLPGGVQYTVLKNGNGQSPDIDDTVLVNYKGMLLNGQVFDSSMQKGGAVSFRLDEIIDGLQDVLQYMEEGARWEVYVPGDLAFKKPARYGGQTLVFEIELLSVEKPETPGSDTGQTTEETVPIDSRLGGGKDHRLAVTVEEKNASEDPLVNDVSQWQQVEIETQRFLQDNAIKDDVISLPSGLQYKVLTAGHGSGLSPRTNDTVRIHFRGTTADGNEFENSYEEGEPLTLIVEQAEKSWQEALLQMEEGAKWALYVPPALAQGSEIDKLGIRGQQPLIYEIELISINQ